MEKKVLTLPLGVISACLALISILGWDYFKILAILAIIVGVASTATASWKNNVEKVTVLGGVLALVGILVGLASLLGPFVVSLLFWL